MPEVILSVQLLNKKSSIITFNILNKFVEEHFIIREKHTFVANVSRLIEFFLLTYSTNQIDFQHVFLIVYEYNLVRLVKQIVFIIEFY